MGRPRKWENDEQRRQAQNARRKTERKAHGVEFVAVDGEGSGRGIRHKYVLLGVGESQISNPEGLTFTEIMDFLWQSYLVNPGASFVGFYLGYDFTQWFKTLPEHRARMLLTEEGRQKRKRKKYPRLGPFPVDWEGWEFDILGMKRFKLRMQGVTGSWMYICDAGSFFQASFMSVIDPKKWDSPVVSEEEYAILEEGKAKRDYASLDAGMSRYNRLENVVLARLMGRTNLGLVQAGISLKRNQWFGPGQAAQAWLKKIGAPDGETVRNVSTIGASPSSSRTELLDAGRGSYYGGWFEIFAHGRIPGNSWEYDINSAYPYIISRLPCLLHGSWRYEGNAGIGGPESDLGSSLVLARGKCVGSDRRIGSMLHRCDDHSIRRPSVTAGWYWGHELSAAYGAGILDRFETWERWIYDPCACPPPLAGIAGLYADRLKVGKNSPQGKGLKLVYNSVYGKFAQSIGNPKYGNAFYASLITSGCRTMILDAIATHPEGTSDVLMVATDGVYFRHRHPHISTGNSLGLWEEAAHSDLTLFKPGVYWDDTAREAIESGSNPAFKARGISAKAFASQIKAVDNHFLGWPERYPYERDPEGPREGWYPKVTFDSGFSMVTCQQALQRHKWFIAGSVGTQELTQDADPIIKRHSGYYEDGIYWSRPYKDGGPELESVPYDRMFGQPDPDEYGINDDGTVKDQWANLIHSR